MVVCVVLILIRRRSFVCLFLFLFLLNIVVVCRGALHRSCCGRHRERSIGRQGRCGCGWGVRYLYEIVAMHRMENCSKKIGGNKKTRKGKEIC